MPADKTTELSTIKPKNLNSTARPHCTCGCASLSNTVPYNKMSHSFQAPIFIFRCPIALLLNGWFASPVTKPSVKFQNGTIWKPIPWPRVFLRSLYYFVFRILKHRPGNHNLEIWVVFPVRSLPMCSCNKDGQLHGSLLKFNGHWLPWLVVSLTCSIPAHCVPEAPVCPGSHQSIF